MDAYIITNIITYLSPANRWGAIIAFGHKKTDEYYHGIIVQQDLLNIETYHLENAAIILRDVVEHLSVGQQKQIINAFLQKCDDDSLLSFDVIELLMNVSWKDRWYLFTIRHVLNHTTKLLMHAAYYEDKHSVDDSNRYYCIKQLWASGLFDRNALDAVTKYGSAKLNKDIRLSFKNILKL